ncbi:YidH family protein [Pseudonocardia sp. HH130630-07]|uniref:YidH family protein n=1 Tax=Pseudonocardia sp. HH130630-07 TaxID=1690815 RepID=UPI0008153E99|nr:DUF202 domain-containing protein [Pseudonocardia sp. HH130630-07]ANY05708.1 hypothetical protein AFB00_04625 [Pseudonocardia sp. HH130630-07]
MTARRFPARLYDRGTEPDPRFTLANERTYLAWIRTAVALLAAGVALEALDVPAQAGLRSAASLVLLGGGILLPLSAWRSWFVTERALRAGRPLPSSGPGVPLAVLVGVVGVLLVLGTVLG